MMSFSKSGCCWGVLLLLTVVAIEIVGSQNGEESMLEMLRFCKKNATRETVGSCFLPRLANKQDAFASGAPEIGIPPLEPFRIPDLNFTEKTTSGRSLIECEFSEIVLKGFTDYDFQDLQVNYDSKSVYLVLSYDKLLLTGKYKMNGHISFLPVQGNGTFWISFSSALVGLNASISLQDDHLHCDNLRVNFNVEGDTSMRFNNVFDDSIIAETLNIFLNENAALVIDEVKPQIVGHLAKEFQRFINAMAKAIKPEDLPGYEYLV